MSCCLDNQWRGVLVKRGLSDLVKEQKQKKCRAEGEKERGGGGGGGRGYLARGGNKGSLYVGQ